MPSKSSPPAFGDDPIGAILGRISAPWWVVILSLAAIALAIIGPLFGLDFRPAR